MCRKKKYDLFFFALFSKLSMPTLHIPISRILCKLYAECRYASHDRNNAFRIFETPEWIQLLTSSSTSRCTNLTFSVKTICEQVCGKSQTEIKMNANYAYQCEYIYLAKQEEEVYTEWNRKIAYRSGSGGIDKRG